VFNRAYPLTDDVRAHLDKRSILSKQFVIDMELCLSALSNDRWTDDDLRELAHVRDAFRSAFNASNRVADLISAEHSVSFLRQPRSHKLR
jgi:hypothetical protein